MERTFKLSQQELAAETKEKDRALHISQKYHDVDIFGPDTTEPITASKNLLARKSPVLEQLIDSLPEDTNHMLYLNDFRSEVIQRMVELVETGETIVKKEDVNDFHHCIDSLEIKGMKDLNADIPQLIKLENGKALCEICCVQLSSMSHGRRHHLRKHATGQDLKCPLCSSKFRVKEYLDDHIRAKHHIKPKELQKASAKVSKKIKIEKVERSMAENLQENDHEAILPDPPIDPFQIETDPIASQPEASEAIFKAPARLPSQANRKRQTERPANERGRKAVKKEAM